MPVHMLTVSVRSLTFVLSVEAPVRELTRAIPNACLQALRSSSPSGACTYVFCYMSESSKT